MVKDLLEEYFRLKRRKRFLVFAIWILAGVATANLFLVLFSVLLPSVYYFIMPLMSLLVTVGYIWICTRIGRIVNRLEEQVGPVEPREIPLQYYRWSERASDIIDVDAIDPRRE